jgi:hypothetical protein
LKILEPRLLRLAVRVSKGGSSLQGDIGIGHMVPVNLMGEGTRRLLSIVLAIANSSGGICLIDGIENGFHYSVIKDVWKAIAQSTRKADVQLFATTHSYECIQAAHEAFVEDGTYDFALHRLDREDGDMEVVTYDKDTLGIGLELFHEVR